MMWGHFAATEPDMAFPPKLLQSQFDVDLRLYLPCSKDISLEGRSYLFFFFFYTQKKSGLKEEVLVYYIRAEVLCLTKCVCSDASHHCSSAALNLFLFMGLHENFISKYHQMYIIHCNFHNHTGKKAARGNNNF